MDKIFYKILMNKEGGIERLNWPVKGLEKPCFKYVLWHCSVAWTLCNGLSNIAKHSADHKIFVGDKLPYPIAVENNHPLSTNNRYYSFHDIIWCKTKYWIWDILWTCLTVYLCVCLYTFSIVLLTLLQISWTC